MWLLSAPPTATGPFTDPTRSHVTTPGRRTPTYLPHLRFTLSGTLGGVGSAFEVFSYGLCMAQPNGFQQDADFINDAMNDLLAFHSRPASAIQANARVRKITCAAINPDGSWTGGKPLLERVVDVAGGVGSAGSNLVHPPQIAWAMSLMTATPGARGRGRFYLPLPAVPVLPTGLVGTTQTQETATSVVTLINALNNSPGVDTNRMHVVVASSYGLNSVVTGVRVGQVLDTIRTRRNALLEAYVQSATAVAP